MTERDPGEGFFDHLDDAGWSAPGNDALPNVLRRGRQLRTRRRTILATSTAVGVTAAVLGGLGVSHALNADGSGDTVVPPANHSQSVTASPTPSGHHRHHGGGGGNQVLLPGATQAPGAHPSGAASTPPPAPAPTDSCAPAAGAGSSGSDPVTGATLPPLAPTPSESPSCAPSATPSPTPSDSGSPEPTDSAEPTTSPTSS